MNHLTPKALRFIPATLGLVFVLLANHAGAANKWWDNNGASAATGGTWDTTTSAWSTTSALTASPTTFASGDVVDFAAGTGTTPTMTITVNSAVTCAGFGTGGISTAGGALVTALGFSGTGSIALSSGMNQVYCGVSATVGNITVSVPITGSGGMYQHGSGWLALYANNSYSGGTSLSGGQIVYYNQNNSFGTGPINVLATGGALSKGSGSGLIIPNNFTFGAAGYAINLAAGTGSPGTTFSGNFPLPASGTTTLQTGGAGQVARITGIVSGASALTVNNSGTLELGGVNTYSGATTVAASTGLSIIGSGSLGSGTYAGNMANSGMFNYASSAAQTLSGIISGAGALTLNNSAAVLTLKGLNTYTGATTNLAGTLIIGGAGYLGSGIYAGSISNSGTIIFASSATQTNSGNVYGSGALIVSNSVANVWFSGLIYNTNITIASGTMVGNKGNPGVFTNAFITFGSSGNSATLDLWGRATMSIAGLAVAPGATGATIQNGSTGNATLQFTGSTTPSTFSGSISNGPGTGTTVLTIAGGSLTLSGVNTYVGVTTINAGSLVGHVAGSIAGPVTITATSGTALQLDNSSAMPASANLVLPASPAASLVNLNFSGTQTINTLKFGSTQKVAGTWGAIGSGANHENAAFTGTGLLSVTAGPSQTITFAIPGTQTYGVAPITLGATSTSGLTVTYTLTAGASIASVSGSGASATLTITGTGSVTVQADLAGNDNYSAAPSVSQTFTVNPRPVQLSGTRTYDGGTAADYSILSVANKVGSDTVSVASGSGTLAGANAGAEPISSFDSLALGNDSAGNYTLTGASGSVTITTASSTNSVAASPNPSLPGSNVTFTATLAAVVPGVGTPTGTVLFKTNGVALSDPVALDGSGLATLMTNSLPHGSNTVTAEYAGDSNFQGSTNSLVQVVNTPPVAPNISGATTENQPLVLTDIKLLSLASDADGDILSLTSAGPTSTNGGTVALVAGNLTYQPVTDFIGTDLFSFVVSDPYGASSTGTVLVTVTSASIPAPNVVIPAAYDSGSGTFSVTFAGIPGYIYTIQTAVSPLGPWSFLKFATAGTNGLFEVIDAQVPPPPAQYYRTVYP